MTDLENLQRQEQLADAEEEKRQIKIVEVIVELFERLSPASQIDLVTQLSRHMNYEDDE